MVKFITEWSYFAFP